MKFCQCNSTVPFGIVDDGCSDVTSHTNHMVGMVGDSGSEFSPLPSSVEEGGSCDLSN